MAAPAHHHFQWRCYNPYAAGIAQASCIKPDHVTGLQSITPYDEIHADISAARPGPVKTLGTIYSASETSSAEWAPMSIAQDGAEIRR